MHLPVGRIGELRSSTLESGHLEKQNTKSALIIEPASEAKGTPYWVCYMNEGDHYMAVHLVFPACVAALSFFLCSLLSIEIVFSSFVAKTEIKLNAAKLPQSHTLQHFPDCHEADYSWLLSISSPLELAPFCLAPSQFFSWAHRGLLFTSCRYIRHFSLLSCLRPFPLLCCWRILFCLLVLSPSWLPALAGPTPHAIGWGDAGTAALQTFLAL